ncbi:MAG: hypothetical protein C4560_09770 [Nitrospiraceae bacterium]|nr:MAG: hypothetical protein C4560_09770 [Nitrospiraceae bacterium]
MSDKQKVLVIGIDGATFDLIGPWIREGHLPNLGRMMKKGTSGELQSTPLSNSAQAWSSFITGKNPGKHGIYDFYEPRSDSYGVRFINASYRKGKSLWKLLSEAGRKAGVINVPITYPPETVNGFIIPGLDSPGMGPDFVYPPGLMEELTEHVGQYILEPGIWGNIRQGKPDLALQNLLKMVKARTAAATYLMTHKEWDLFMVVYTASDKVQHHFWKYIDPDRPESKVKTAYSDAIFQVYVEIDRGIGEMIKQAGDASVIVMSDHGAGPSTRKTMYINRWLSAEGFLTFKDVHKSAGGFGHFKYLLVDRTNNWLKKMLPRGVKERLLRLFPRLRDRVESMLFLPGIEWKKTAAYSRENHPAIYINTNGREIDGTVSPGEDYNKVRNRIIERLKALRCPDTGEPIAGRIYTREELFNGPDSMRAPDIIFEWNKYQYVHRPSGRGNNKDFLEILKDDDLLKSENYNRPSGIHRDYGIFAGSGKNLGKTRTVENINIYDIAPTILYLLGVPVPEDMDGRIIEDAIDDDYLKQNSLEKISSSVSDGQYQHVFDADEAKVIEDRLKGLGYID